MHFILTGDVEVGKTTVCQEIITLARESQWRCGGIITLLKSDRGKRIEDIETLAQVDFAHRRSIPFGLPISRYRIRPDGIDFANQVVRRSGDADLLVVDELGRLELKGKGLGKSLDILDRRRHKCNLLVIRKKLLQFYQNRLNCEVEIFEVNFTNRSTLAEPVFEAMKSCRDNRFS